MKNAVEGKAGGVAAIHEQLQFTVIAPNRPPVPLSLATHVVIVEAVTSEHQQVKGRQRNIKVLERAAKATARWPTVPVGELIAKRLIRLEDLLPVEETG